MWQACSTRVSVPLYYDLFEFVNDLQYFVVLFHVVLSHVCFFLDVCLCYTLVTVFCNLPETMHEAFAE